eukprot:CAMPEP_0171325396 /NCGR_PEP_ID=MMETSP0816-20121228/116784_1 /TAXON_ID=420281 /ORGANISM="Proboscia inermis, Strain CCAP1064/1" /LENGTH=227 /DNA_ID=CAMNT_0011824565 /DNA_START=303 /DNA_END=986 /DNA_ORIENTATION=-
MTHLMMGLVDEFGSDQNFEGGSESMMEELFKQMNFAEEGNPSKGSSKSGSSDSSNKELNVDQTVEKLLNDMAAASSNDGVPGTSDVEGLGEDMMESMMKEFEKMAQKDDSSDVIDDMMKQLLSKDLMYEPMKKVTERFPRWLAESKSHLSEVDYNRHGQQYQYFQRIVALYEHDPDNFPRLMELMQDIQEFGQPPAEIINDLAPGLEFNKDGMPKMDGFQKDQCTTM